LSVRSISDFPYIVEAPLLPACYAFYNKNIRTLMSSANRRDTSGGEAYVLVDFENLSGDNKSIAEAVVSSGFAERHPANRHIDVERLRISMPVGPETTIAEVEAHFRGVASRFKKQSMTWAVRNTIDELVEIFCSPSLLTNPREQVAKDVNMYHDKETDLFFL